MSGHKLAKCTSFSKLSVWQCSGNCNRKEQPKFVEAQKKSKQKVKHNLHLTHGVLSQHYWKLNDYAHYLNTLFCSWTTALCMYCRLQEEPHQKKTLHLPKRCVIRQAFTGMLATCSGTWMCLLPQDLARLWPLSSADSGIAVFHGGGGNETAVGGCSEVTLLQRESASKRRGPRAFKRN